MLSENAVAPLDFALRVCESVAFGLHSILGLSEPWTGCLRNAFRDGGAMPSWFWPTAGLILLVVAFANFSSHSEIVLVAQAYVASFHFGAMFYHLRLGHHPAASLPPLLFVVFAATIAAFRVRFAVVVLGLGLSLVFAYGLSIILVRRPPPAQAEEASILHGRVP